MGEWPFGLLRRYHYGVLFIDPPWKYQTYDNMGGVPQRAEEQHYETMTVEELMDLPVPLLCRTDCAVFMWSTSSHVQQCFALAEHWQLRFASKAFTWAKTNPNTPIEAQASRESTWFMGMGHGTRRQTEDCWLFATGRPTRFDAGVRELIVSPVREHSRKPDEAYSRAARLFQGPYAELFSRTPRLNWSTWGKERNKFGGSDETTH